MYNENVETEYKLARNELPKDIWPTYSAFANTVGGVIVLGIGEVDNGVFEIRGVENPIKIIDDFWNTITSKDKVNINILSDKNIHIEQLEGKTVIIIEIPEAEYKVKPVMVRDKKKWTAYKRLGSGDREATSEQLKYMYANQQVDLDSILLDGFDMEDLNFGDVIKYREEVIGKEQDSRYEKMSNYEFLKEIGVFKRKRPSKEYSLTVGGLLFFGKYQSIIDYHPGFQLDYFRKVSAFDTDWVDRISSGDMSYPEINIYSFYNVVYERITSRIEEAFLLDSKSKRMPYRNDLSKTIRESLVNTLMHAYYGADAPLKITEYPDYIEFYNPGDMRISPSEFIIGGTSKLRNSTLSVLFRKVGIAEKAGSGGPRIYDVVSKYHLRSPDILPTDHDTLIRLWKTDLISSLSELDEKQKAIVHFVVLEGSISKKQAIDRLELTEYAFLTAINELITLDVLTKDGQGRNTKYHLKKNTEASVFSSKQMLRILEDKLRNKRQR